MVTHHVEDVMKNKFSIRNKLKSVRLCSPVTGKVLPEKFKLQINISMLRDITLFRCDSPSSVAGFCPFLFE